jgi:hypothetical protein
MRRLRNSSVKNKGASKCKQKVCSVVSGNRAGTDGGDEHETRMSTKEREGLMWVLVKVVLEEKVRSFCSAEDDRKANRDQIRPADLQTKTNV